MILFIHSGHLFPKALGSPFYQEKVEASDLELPEDYPPSLSNAYINARNLIQDCIADLATGDQPEVRAYLQGLPDTSIYRSIKTQDGIPTWAWTLYWPAPQRTRRSRFDTYLKIRSINTTRDDLRILNSTNWPVHIKISAIPVPETAGFSVIVNHNYFTNQNMESILHSTLTKRVNTFLASNRWEVINLSEFPSDPIAEDYQTEQALIELLLEGDYKAKMYAAKQLQQLGSKLSVPYLLYELVNFPTVGIESMDYASFLTMQAIMKESGGRRFAYVDYHAPILKALSTLAVPYEEPERAWVHKIEEWLIQNQLHDTYLNLQKESK